VSSLAVVTWLGWACYAGAAVALVAYLVQVAGRGRWRRPWNAAGLVFTSVALSQTPYLFDPAMYGRSLRTAVVVTVCMVAAAALQAFTALRPRRAAAAQGQDA
jgi:hypothetical protein